MNAAASAQRDRLDECSSIDVMSRYITLTAQIRHSACADLVAMRDALRETILTRLGLEVGCAFIREVDSARRR